MTEMQKITIQGTDIEISRESINKSTPPIRIGDRCRILKKEYNGYKAYPGVVVSFTNFKDLPTINIVYVDHDYSSCNLKTIAYNEETKDFKIAFLEEDNKELDIDKSTVLERFDREIEKKKEELSELFYKKAYFEKNFGKFFSGI